MEESDRASLRACGAVECEYKVPNGVKDIDHVLKALNNHLLATHGNSQKQTSTTAKSTATLPALGESISETAYQVWLYRFDRYCISCHLSDDDIKNRVLEAVPTILADQIFMDLKGDESKEVIFK